MLRNFTCIAIAAIGFHGTAHAQFVSGSDGSDGALSVAGGQGSFAFDTSGLDTDGDGVFHFTTIDVGAGTTLILRADNPGLSEGVPVVWLATGAVTIAGSLDLRGGTGHRFDNMAVASNPGAGGFAGGRGGQVGNDFPPAAAAPAAGWRRPRWRAGARATGRQAAPAAAAPTPAPRTATGSCSRSSAAPGAVAPA